jgi:hypothetical protein
MFPDRQHRRVVWTYLSVRKIRWLIGVAVLTGALVACFGSIEVATPTATGEGTTVQFWRLFSVAAGSLPVLSLTSSLQDLEAVAGAQFHRCRRLILGIVFLVSGLLVLAGAAFTGDITVVERAARALLAWFGLALISGRLFGWRLSWVAPWVAVCAILYWGYDGDGRSFRWWEFTAQPIGHVPSLVLTALLLSAGLIAYYLTPWRISHLASRRLQRRESSMATARAEV